MLGTPNEGVFLAGLLHDVCTWHAIFHLSILGTCVAVNVAGRLGGVDLHSDAIRDLSPGSQVIRDLDSLALPPTVFSVRTWGFTIRPAACSVALTRRTTAS